MDVAATTGSRVPGTCCGVAAAIICLRRSGAEPPVMKAEDLTYDDLDNFVEHCRRIVTVHSIRIDLSQPGASTTASS
jgi:hypothetical protein